MLADGIEAGAVEGELELGYDFGCDLLLVFAFRFLKDVQPLK